MPEDRAGLRFAIEDVAIEFSRVDWIEDVPGIRAREMHVEGHRWAIVEYAPGAKRQEWCFDGHAGFVISPNGDAFALSTGRAHRGTNLAEQATRVFVIDDPADSSR